MKAKFILSKKAVHNQLKRCYELADEVSYSAKTNYEVCKILESTNCFFSIHSKEVVNQIKNKDKIWFFAQGWNQKEIEDLHNQGVTSFVVDNKEDLNTLINSNKKVNLLLRMRLKESTVHTGKHFVFGFYSREINNLIPELRKNKNIKTLGIHFHRKTQNVSEWSLISELEDSLDKNTLKSIDVLNIGGGIPSIYKNYRVEALESLLIKIKELRDWLNRQDIKVIVEPGRFIAAPSVKLVTEVKNIYNNNIILNASVYNSAMDTFIAHIRLLVENESEEGTPYVLKGSTPDSLDIYRYRVFLKEVPKIGDKITFLNAGAYNFNTEFCNLPKLETEVVE